MDYDATQVSDNLPNVATEIRQLPNMAVRHDATQVSDNTIYVAGERVQATISGGACPGPNKSYTLEQFQSLGEEPRSRRLVGYPPTPSIMRWARALLGDFGDFAPPPPPAPPPADASGARPDVTFILADDLGYNELNFMNGTRGIATPSLDALAGSGVVLRNYYVAPICSPTRSVPAARAEPALS